MVGIIDRYTSAVRSRNLKSDQITHLSDNDVIGAAGLASKRAPLGMALLRLFAGDNGAASRVVDILASKAIGKAYRLGRECPRVEAEDIAKTVLTWHCHAACTECGGHGVKKITGTTTLGDDSCRPCGGLGKIPFNRQFQAHRLALAQWLSAEIEKEQSAAGSEVIRMLAPKIEI